MKSTPPVSAAWYLNLDLVARPVKKQDTTDFSRAEVQPGSNHQAKLRNSAAEAGRV